MINEDLIVKVPLEKYDSIFIDKSDVTACEVENNDNKVSKDKNKEPYIFFALNSDKCKVKERYVDCGSQSYNYEIRQFYRDGDWYEQFRSCDKNNVWSEYSLPRCIPKCEWHTEGLYNIEPDLVTYELNHTHLDPSSFNEQLIIANNLLTKNDNISLGFIAAYKDADDGFQDIIRSFHMYLQGQPHLSTIVVERSPYDEKLYIPVEPLLRTIDQFRASDELQNTYLNNPDILFKIIAHEISEKYDINLINKDMKSIRDVLQEQSNSKEKEVISSFLCTLRDEITKYNYPNANLAPLNCNKSENLVLYGVHPQEGSFKESTITKIGDEDYTTSFSNCDFSSSKFSKDANIEHVRFTNCYFSNVDLSNANIKAVTFDNCKFTIQELRHLPNNCNDVKFNNCSFDMDTKMLVGNDINQEIRIEFYNRLKNDYKDTYLVNCNPSFSQMEKVAKAARIDKNKSAGRK